jgi:hypothetical protein
MVLVPTVFIVAEGHPTYIATSNTHPRSNREPINVTTDRYKRTPILSCASGVLPQTNPTPASLYLNSLMLGALLEIR